MMLEAAKPSKAFISTGGRRTLNPWIVVGLILILLIAFILIERYIQRSIEGPGHLQESVKESSQLQPIGRLIRG